jgi:hypothetical protein
MGHAGIVPGWRTTRETSATRDTRWAGSDAPLSMVDESRGIRGRMTRLSVPRKPEIRSGFKGGPQADVEGVP